MTPAKKSWRIALLTVAASVAALGIACSGDGDGEASTPDPTSTAAATTAPGGNGGTADGEAREIEVLMQDNSFEPNEIRIKAGERVKVEAKNEGTAMHNMIVSTSDAEGQDFQSDTMVNPGDDSEFEMTVQTPGTYQFFCAFHMPGMTGTLIVE